MLPVCVFRAATSDPTASPKRHPDPRPQWGSGSRSLRRTGCLELTASAVGSDGRPLPARTPRASGAGGKPNPRSAERPDHANRTGPAPPAQPCPARSQPSALGAEADGRQLQRRKLLHLLFVSLRVWRWLWHRPGPGPRH